MIFVLITCGIIIIALLAVVISLRNDRKFMTEMYHSLKSDHNRVLDKWKKTINDYETILEICEEATGLNKKVIELNRELRTDISDFEQRISSLEKIYALYIISDNDAQKICPATNAPCCEFVPGGPCAIEEEEE